MKRKIDEHVSAAHKVDMGKRRIPEDVMRGKHAHLSYKFLHLIAVADLFKIFLQTLR